MAGIEPTLHILINNICDIITEIILFCINCQAETKNPKFCSSSCSAKIGNKGRIRTKKSKDELSLKMKNLIVEGKLLSFKERGLTNKGSKWSKLQGVEMKYKRYRISCKFILKQEELKTIKGYDLLEKHGIWHPKRNKNGVSKDHKYSVFDGFFNDVPSNIISHPANCEIMQQKKNSGKNKKSSITYEELLEYINVWPV